MRRMLRQCLGPVGKQAVCGQWDHGPRAAFVPVVALRGLPAPAVRDSDMTKPEEEVISEVRYEVGAVLAGIREVPCLAVGACSRLQTIITRVFAHGGQRRPVNPGGRALACG